MRAVVGHGPGCSGDCVVSSTRNLVCRAFVLPAWLRHEHQSFHRIAREHHPDEAGHRGGDARLLTRAGAGGAAGTGTFHAEFSREIEGLRHGAR